MYTPDKRAAQVFNHFFTLPNKYRYNNHPKDITQRFLNDPSIQHLTLLFNLISHIAMPLPSLTIFSVHVINTSISSISASYSFQFPVQKVSMNHDSKGKSRGNSSQHIIGWAQWPHQKNIGVVLMNYLLLVKHVWGDETNVGRGNTRLNIVCTFRRRVRPSRRSLWAVPLFSSWTQLARSAEKFSTILSWSKLFSTPPRTPTSRIQGIPKSSDITTFKLRNTLTIGNVSMPKIWKLLIVPPKLQKQKILLGLSIAKVTVPSV